MASLVLLLVLGTSIWVGFDGRSRDFSTSSFARSTTTWVIGCLAMWIVCFPMYLAARGKHPRTRTGRV